MKIGIRVNIDVTKIDKSAIYEGKNGKYVGLTMFVDPDTADQYGNHGMVTQDLGKERKEEKGPILGNAKVFWQGEGKGKSKPKQQDFTTDFNADEDIPF